MNVKNWYVKRSATEKGALISGAFLLLVTLCTISHQRSQLKSENAALLDKLEQKEADILQILGERDMLHNRLAPFEAIAVKSFPNESDRRRLDLLIQTVEELNRKYGSFELRRADDIEFAQATRQFAELYHKDNDSKPKVYLTLYATATDASRRLFEHMRITLREGGWDVKGLVDLLDHPIERGIWLYTKNPENPSKPHLFWNYLFVKLGLNLKNAYWGGEIGDDEVVIVINDPSYIR